jgi:hypothetical protein
MDKKQQEKEKRETPITDGDARPDMPTDPRNEKGKKPGKRANRKFETERLSDMNSLEDYKDAQ